MTSKISGISCPHCGAQNQARKRVCVQCGQPLSGAITTSPQEKKSRNNRPLYFRIFIILMIGVVLYIFNLITGINALELVYSAFFGG